MEHLSRSKVGTRKVFQFKGASVKNRGRAKKDESATNKNKHKSAYSARTRATPAPVLLALGIQGNNLIVPADKSKWSESSKNSYSYESCIEYYTDISYKCYKCGNCAVFTAEDQKEAFEVRKCYVWQRRDLCTDCYDEFNALKATIKGYEKLWGSESDSSKGNAPYIRDWLLALNRVPSFGKCSNQAMIRHLEKHLDNNA